MMQRNDTITPGQRLARMRKSFEKNKSVLTEDYKYFTTPEKPAKQKRKQSEGKSSKCQPTR
jgi:hypothetical protein